MGLYRSVSPALVRDDALSYAVANSILNASRERKKAELPTPYQLSMLLGVFKQLYRVVVELV